MVFVAEFDAPKRSLSRDLKSERGLVGGAAAEPTAASTVARAAGEEDEHPSSFERPSR